MPKKYLVAGNWKMNLLTKESGELAKSIAEYVNNNEQDNIEVLICPPFLNIEIAKLGVKGSKVKIGAQNCHFEQKGAYTGEVSPQMIADTNCEYVIIGHSERRQYFDEKDEEINRKVKAALDAGLKVVLCIGETLEEREAGKTNDVIKTQLSAALQEIPENEADNIVIAYEPVWAIGTGVVAEPVQADEAHNYIRLLLSEKYSVNGAEMLILYGGSMKPGNAESLLKLENVNGGLIGGASLKAEDFTEIIKIATQNI